MIPAAFDYKVADSAEAAIAMLGEYGDEAKLLAGGHSLIPMMKFRLAAPTVLVDIGRVDDDPFVLNVGRCVISFHCSAGVTGGCKEKQTQRERRVDKAFRGA